MRKTLLIFTFLLSIFIAKAQQIEIGQINNGVYEFSLNQLSVAKAFEWTFRDGSKVIDLKIEQLNNNYFLVAQCTYQSHKRMAAVDLDLIGTNFILNEDAFLKICSAVACENCRFFFEYSKIVACKCEETSTISNHCHYRSAPATTFFQNLQRAISLNKEKN